MSAASSARVLQVEGAIHTSEVAVNARSASPWAAAGTAAARVRSSKVYGLRSKGILLAKEGNGDLSEVSGEHHKAWRMCYMRCEHLFTPLTVTIIPVAPDPPSAPRARPLLSYLRAAGCAGPGVVECITGLGIFPRQKSRTWRVCPAASCFQLAALHKATA